MANERRKKHGNRSRRAKSGNREKSGKMKAHNQKGPTQENVVVSPLSWKEDKLLLITGVVILAATFAWAYWPTLARLVKAWDTQPDYSHGYFVVPLALYFLWARRDNFPGLPNKLAWPGLLLIATSIGVRMFGARYYVDAIDAWSMLFWVAGVVWLLGGRRILWWSLPSVAFLWFMIPLPWHAERWAGLPLQRIATKLSCFVLQSLGQPALGEGNTIFLGDIQLEVEAACSGLRIFVGIFALAFAYVILVRRAWWERIFLLLSAIPIALIAKSTRIVVTGLLHQFVSGEAAEKFTHDVTGWVMIPFAAALFALVLWYLGKLVREVEVVDVGKLVRPEPV